MLSNILSLIICILSIGTLLFLIANTKAFALVLIFLILLAIIFPEEYAERIINKLIKCIHKIIKFIVEIPLRIMTKILF